MVFSLNIAKLPPIQAKAKAALWAQQFQNHTKTRNRCVRERTATKDTKEDAEVRMLENFWRDETDALARNDPSHTNLTVASHKDVPRALLDALAKNTTVKAAHFELTAWNDETCDALLASGAPSEQLRQLYLARNLITSAGLPSLISATLERGFLTTLNLSSNQLGDDLGRLGSAVARRGSLTCLNLDQTQHSGEGLLSLAKGLRCASCAGAAAGQLRTLHLQGNGIGDVVAGQIAASLSACTEELYLGRNAIRDEGAKHLAMACALHRVPLRRLSLVYNRVGNEGCCGFARALDGGGGDARLRILNLSHNAVGDQGAAALTRCLRQNTCLEALDISVNPVSKEHANALQEAMAPAARRQRRLVGFCSTVRLLLLAHSRSRQVDAEPEPVAALACLPHCVLLLILQLACPADVFADLAAKGLSGGRLAPKSESD